MMERKKLEKELKKAARLFNRHLSELQNQCVFADCTYDTDGSTDWYHLDDDSGIVIDMDSEGRINVKSFAFDGDDLETEE